MCQVCAAQAAGLWRYETSGEITLLAVDYRSHALAKWPVGTRIPIDGKHPRSDGATHRRPRADGQAMRIARGQLAARLREVGVLRTVSLDEPLGDDDSSPRGESVPDERIADPYTDLASRTSHRDVEAVPTDSCTPRKWLFWTPGSDCRGDRRKTWTRSGSSSASPANGFASCKTSRWRSCDRRSRSTKPFRCLPRRGSVISHQWISDQRLDAGPLTFQHGLRRGVVVRVAERKVYGFRRTAASNKSRPIPCRMTYGRATRGFGHFDVGPTQFRPNACTERLTMASFAAKRAHPETAPDPYGAGIGDLRCLAKYAGQSGHQSACGRRVSVPLR